MRCLSEPPHNLWQCVPVYLAANSNARSNQIIMITAQRTNNHHSRVCCRHHARSEDCFSQNALFIDYGPEYRYKPCLMFKRRVNILDLFIHHSSTVQIHGSLSRKKPLHLFWHTRRSTLAMQNPGSLENAPKTPSAYIIRLSPPQVPVESEGRRLGVNG